MGFFFELQSPRKRYSISVHQRKEGVVMDAKQFSNYIDNAKKGADGQWSGRCPAHDDKHSSLSFKNGDNGNLLIHCHAACTLEAILAALRLQKADLINNSKGYDRMGKEEEYTYTDENGKTVGKKTRYIDKRFSWSYIDENGEIVNRKPENCPLYNLSSVVTTNEIFVVEGEKDVETLKRFGIAAVCSPDGAGPGKWRKGYNEALEGKEVIIFADNDKIGLDFANEEATSIYPHATSVRIVDLREYWAEVPNHGDISDYVDAFGEKKLKELFEIVRSKQAFEPISIRTGLNTIPVSEFLKKDIAPVQFIVEGFLPTGLAILASPPKYGKSFFALNLSLDVTYGDSFLGFETHEVGVLYMALEDSENRLKERISMMIGERQVPNNLYLAFNAEDMGDGLIEALKREMLAHPDIRLIIVDTMAKIRSKVTHKNGVNSYASDYVELGMMKKFADERGICVLLISHLRKMPDAADPFNMILGSTGILGAVDTAIVMTRDERISEKTKMMITGRDVEENTYLIERNSISGKWSMWGSYEIIDKEAKMRAYESNGIVASILLAVSAGNGRWSGTLSELISFSKTLPDDKCIQEVPIKLSNTVKALERDLYDNSGIIHEVRSNGTGGKTHIFRRIDDGS